MVSAVAWSGIAADTPDVTTVEELVAALTALNEGTRSDTTIKVAPGIYDLSTAAMCTTAHLYCSAGGVEIVGTDESSWRTDVDKCTKTVFLGDKTKRIFFGEGTPGAVFRHVTFKNGYAKIVDDDTYPRGGALKGASSVTNCVFIENKSAKQGGATHGCSANDCYFRGNGTDGSDGGAMVSGALAANCLFEKNGWAQNGGGCCSVGTITNCVFIGNSAQNGGGTCGSNMTVVDCTFLTNHVDSAGGAICNWESDADIVSKPVYVRGCHFEGNYGSHAGACSKALLITNCTFVANYADNGSTQGGTVHVPSPSCRIVDCVFDANRGGRNSGCYGGAVHGPADKTSATDLPLVEKCTFRNNVSTNGGAVAFCRIKTCTFDGDTALFSGGGAYGSAAEGCTFTNCCSLLGDPNTYNGGGGCSKMLQVTNCTFRNCSAVYGGGVMFCDGVVDNVFEGCVASVRGGGSCNCDVTACLFTNCQCLASDLRNAGGASVRGWGSDEPICTAYDSKFINCNNPAEDRQRVGTSLIRNVGCTFFNCGAAKSLIADRCRFLGDGSTVGGVFEQDSKYWYSYALDEGTAVNCLFSGNEVKYLFYKVSRLTNCTVVDNSQNLQKNTGRIFGTSTTAVNCIFKNNLYTTADGASWDVIGDAGLTVTLQNCIYGTTRGSTVVATDCFDAEKSRLFYAPNNARYDTENPYRLRCRSIAVDRGCDVGFTDKDLDLAGLGRINNIVDIGAYEDWLESVGLMINLR